MPVEMLERLGALLRDAPRAQGGVAVSDAALGEAGWSPPDAAMALRSLGYTPARRPEAGQPMIWRRRKAKVEAKSIGGDQIVAGPGPSLSPFAALAQMNVRPAPAAAKRPTRRRRPRKPRSVVGAA